MKRTATITLMGRLISVEIGTRGESYGGMRGATTDHLLIAGKPVCGLRGSFVREPLTKRSLPWTGCAKCAAALTEDRAAFQRPAVQRHMAKIEGWQP